MAFGCHKDEKYQTLIQNTDPPENFESFLWKIRFPHQEQSRGKPRPDNYNRYQPYHQRGESFRNTTMPNNTQDQ